MNRAKIQLSPDELRLVSDAQFILTKNEIIKKIYELFGLLAEAYRTDLPGKLPLPAVSSLPKISRGENYMGLPYVILDYPRYFNREDVFAIRTMFWWGNDFSIILHLKGLYKNLYYKTVLTNAAQLKKEGWFIQGVGDEWQHHRLNDTHQSMAELTENELLSIIEKGAFIKIAYYFHLQQLNEAEQTFKKCFLSIMKMLQV